MIKLTLLLPLIFIAGCFANPNLVAASTMQLPGFLLGFWHGFIAPAAFVCSFFTDIGIYEVVNNGGWYDFGFLLGIGAFSSGVSS